MQLSQSATWELQQLVSLLQIDPQNVGVDTVSVGLGSGKTGRLTTAACQTLGVKIAHQAEIRTGPRRSPQPPAPVRSPPSTTINGVGRERLESPASSPCSLSPPGRLAGGGARGRARGLGSIKLAVGGGRGGGGSNGRSSSESDSGWRGGGMGPATTTRPPQNSNVIKMVNTRKRRSSAEAGRYSELDNDTDPATVKRARGGKTSRGGKGLGRGLGGAGGVRRGGRGEGRGAGGLHRRPGSRGLHDMYNSQTWKCAICGQYDPIGEDDDGDTTEWIGCDCNRCVHPESPDLLWLGGFTSK